MGEPLPLSVDGAFAALVAHVVRDVLRAELEPLRGRLDVLAAASAPALVDVATAAERLGLSTATVRRQAAAGELPARRVGRSWRIDMASLRPPSPKEIAALAREARGR